MRKNLLLFTLQVLVILFGAFTTTTAQTIDLTTSPYLQNFNAIGDGLPNGVTVRTGAHTGLGSSQTFTTSSSTWASTNGAFKNFASANDLSSDATTAAQNAATNRALGIRQTGSLGDPGGAFVFQITNTENKNNFSLKFKLQSLDASSGRQVTWRVDYAIGNSPTVFTVPTTTGNLITGGTTFSNNEIDVDFGTALNNLSQLVTIRIVTTSASATTGVANTNRPSSAIDDFELSWEDANGPILTPTPTELDFPTTNISTTSNALSFSLAGTNLTADANLTVAAPFSISATEDGGYGTSLNIPVASFSASQTVYVRFSPTAAQVYNGAVTINSTGAAQKTVILEGEGFNPASPIVTPSIANLTFTGVPVGGESAIQTYTITAANLTGDVTITGSAGFLVSTDGTSFTTSVVVAQADGQLSTGKTIYARSAPSSSGAFSGTITHTSAGADTEVITVSGTGVGVINLTSSPYLQDFNGIGSGLPDGITGRSAATTNVLGTVLPYPNAEAAWTVSNPGGLKNYRSGIDDAPTTDRAFGIRQVGGTDPGAAFVFQIANTTNKINFTLDFSLQSLDASSPRATTWRVDYGIGVNPTSFIAATTTGNLTTGGNTFSVEDIHVDFGNSLDNITDVVTIRIAAISSSAGGGNRASTAIDNFTLNWQSPTDKTISASVNGITFPATNLGGQFTQTYTVNSNNLNDNLVVTATGAFTVSSDGTNFGTTASIAPPNSTAATIHVRFSPTATGVFTGTLTHTSTGAFTRVININGEGIDPNALAFNFNTCTVTNLPGSGFLSINTTGAQKWGCSSYGRNSSNGVDVNGYANGAAQTNEAWLISPILNLDNFNNMPVLSFYSRGEFNGPILKLYISTTYDGASVPNVANWTEITNAGFPTPSGSASNVWTFSDNIDLSAYKGLDDVRIAFVYTSSNGVGAARWSIDDIAITDQSSLITATPNALNFGEVSVGAQSVGLPITFRAVGGTSDYTITAPAGYQLSNTLSGTYSNSIVIPLGVAEDPTNFYVRFAPQTKALKIEGNVVVTSVGLNKSIISVTGSSFPKSETLDIVSYNLSFFGSNSNNTATPADVTTQINNITTVLQRLDSDVIGFQEMSSDDALTTLVGNLPGYASVTAPKWSYSFNPPDPTFPPQKIGFIYNTNTMTLSTTEPPRILFDQIYEDARTGVPGHPITGYPTGTASSFWSSGRLPYMATFNTNINGVNEKIRIVVLHAKSGSAVADYNRRVYDLQVLKDSLDAQYPTDKVVILGDYNDRLFGSIAVGSPSSYSMFLNDPARYNPITLPLDQAGRTSFPSRGNLIDHFMITNELSGQYIATSADIEDPRSYISPYNATTGSDHLPVFARFSLTPIALPVTFTHVQAIQKQKAVTVEWITASETDNAYFIVERSADGVNNFQNIGRVSGNGTTTTAHQYWFNDEAPLSGTNYYRVKQVDIDDEFSYSKVVKVSFTNQSTEKILIAPNPVNKNIRLQLTNSNSVYQLQVYGVDGKILLQNTGVEMQLNTYLNSQLNKLTKGLYFIKVKGDGNTVTSKFVKE